MIKCLFSVYCSFEDFLILTVSSKLFTENLLKNMPEENQSQQ